ncbi:MAG TPA: DinB family protein [Ktedonobacterales bacterium]|nr:DinB family protein [Ktedonobacterales bacterium]
MEQQQTPEESMALYAQGVDELTFALEGLSKQELDLRPTEGEWSIRQIVHHITDGDDLWSMALKAALANSGCLYRHDWYTPDNAWAESLDYAGREIEPAVALFRANRAAVLQLVRHLPNAWERSMRFEAPYLSNPEQVTVGEIIVSQASHALAHCEEIRQIRRSHSR